MKVLILDGYNLLFRSFTTLPDSIKGPDDQPINGVYGLLSSLVRMAREQQPGHIVAAMDRPEVSTFRHRKFSGYQAQRGPLGGERANEFKSQVNLMEKLLPDLGIPVLSRDGYEADDVMGTLAIQVVHAAGEAVLVSTDRDLLQLVRKGIKILVPGGSGKIIGTASDVHQVLGVCPEGVTAFKALAGDASDNIPGVAGIGSKTAAALVNTYGSLDNIYAHLVALPPRTRRRLAEAEATARTFHEIVTIVTDLDMPVDVRNLPQPKLPRDTSARRILDDHGLGRGNGTPGGIRTPDL